MDCANLIPGILKVWMGWWNLFPSRNLRTKWRNLNYSIVCHFGQKYLPNPITINHKHNFQLACFLHTGSRLVAAVPTVFIGFSDNYRYISIAHILLPLGLCHCCGRLVQEDFVCVVDDVWLSSASPRRRLDPRRVSSKLTLAWRAKNMSGRMLSLQSGQANVLCLFHKIYG